MTRNEPLNNQLLAALPAMDWQRVQHELVRISMPAGMVLYEAGAALSHVYFPASCVVSVLYVTRSGLSTEIAVVGNEGLVGMPLLMGGGSTISRAVVQTAGVGYSMSAAAIAREMGEPGAMALLMLRFTQTLMAQVVQIAACNRHHSLQQRLCRSLLASLDRVSGNELLISQKQMADTLGARRGGVAGAAAGLKDAGLIIYARGHVTVLDRPGVEDRACECYGVVKDERLRLMRQVAVA